MDGFQEFNANQRRAMHIQRKNIHKECFTVYHCIECPAIIDHIDNAYYDDEDNGPYCKPCYDQFCLEIS